MDILKFNQKLNQRSGEPQAHTLIRLLGSKALTQLGWPSKKLEPWRYSPVQRLQKNFIPALSQNTEGPWNVKQLVEKWSSDDFSTIIVENGKILQLPSELSGKIELKTLAEALALGLIDSGSFSQIADVTEALNISFFDQGFYLCIGENVKIDRPIRWLQTFCSNEANSLFQSRLLIHLKPNAACTIVESHVAMDSSAESWINVTTTLQLDAKSELNFVQWSELESPQQYTSRTYASVDSHSHFHHLQGALSKGWFRNDLRINFVGIESEVYAHGIGLALNDGIVDQQSQLTFMKTSNRAEQIYKNLVLERSRAIFNGSVKILPEAQKTDSSQLHQSLLLSKDAEVNTKPELEIYADDVKATHGASIGQLSLDEIFYFQSRGITEAKARAMLSTAFLLDLCERVNQESVRTFLKARIQEYWKREQL
jgi:Fe-S cluster assembly protein SufD